jgi:iron(III) transport system permease protein
MRPPSWHTTAAWCARGRATLQITKSYEAPRGVARWAPRLPPLDGAGVLWGVAVLLAALIVGLLLVIVWSSFIVGQPRLNAALTLANYVEVFRTSLTYPGMVNSLLIATGTVLLNLVIAVPAAYLVHRTDLPWRGLFTTLMLVGVIIPGFLKAIGWILLLSPQIGLINQVLRAFIPIETGPLSIYNLGGVIFIQGLMLTPVMFFTVAAATHAMNPDLEEAAAVSGAGPLAVLRRVTVPLMQPAILAAVIYNFMTAIALFEIPALIGNPGRVVTLPTLMYSSVHTDVGLPRYGMAGVYGLLLLVPTLFALYMYQRMLHQGDRYAVVTGKGYRPRVMTLGRWKGAALAFLFTYFTLSLFLPFVVLVWTSFLPYIQVPSPAALASLNLNAYAAVLAAVDQRVLGNTIALALLVGLLVTALSLAVSWIVVRTRYPGRRTLDTIAMLPHASPSIGIAFAVAFVALAFANVVPLYGSVGAIVVAHVVAYISFGTRTANSALVQVHRELEEAAHTSGASAVVALRRVILPLVAPAVFYTLVWVSLLSLREVTMALFLQRSQNTVLSTQIWNYWTSSKPSEAAALGTMLVVVVTVLFAILMRFAGHRIHR